MNYALNLYNACDGYKSAVGDTVGWTKRNPDLWNIASMVLAEMKAEKANGNP